jgi:hypothetical protein
MHRSCLLPALAVAALALLSGCGGGPATTTVSGSANYKGAPITFGSIVFQSDLAVENPVATGEIREGKYTVKGVVVGPNKIGVQSLPTAKPGVMPPGVKGMVGDTNTNAPKGPYVPLPPKYSQPSSSGLTFDAKAGDQKHDLDLQP